MTVVSTTGNKTAAANADPLTTLVNTLQSYFEGAALLVRRTFFNQAPTVAGVQVVSSETTVYAPIDGQVAATDPERDTLVYKVTSGPKNGTVVLNSSTGAYTYTPNSDFTGIDSFTVSVTDTGTHINLLNWFRGASTSTAVGVYEQPAGTHRITFSFSYGSGSQLWSSAARADLAASAISLSSYFDPQYDVTITYKVTGQYSLMGSTLASAGSDLISSDPGFYDTVVQYKILTGIDSNGEGTPDGTIDWNFGYSWGLGDTVSNSQYDFQSTAMHELLHTFGFLSVVDSAGNNTDPNWTTFDGFIVTSNGTHVINGTTYVFNTAYNSNLTGGKGSLFFKTSDGSLVPLYTPTTWSSGSSMSHLDDLTFTGSLEKLMNAASDTGIGVRTLSDYEIAIMTTLGYTMVSQSAVGGLLFISVIYVRRRKQRALVAR